MSLQTTTQNILFIEIDVNHTQGKFPNKFNPSDIIKTIYCILTKPNYEIIEKRAFVFENLDHKLTSTDIVSSVTSDIIITNCTSEINLIFAVGSYVKSTNPKIITGYNICGFDMKYIHDRMCIFSDGVSDCEFIEKDFCKSFNAEYVKEELESNALGSNTMFYYKFGNSQTIDILQLVKTKLPNLMSYKLKNVLEENLGIIFTDKPMPKFEELQHLITLTNKYNLFVVEYNQKMTELDDSSNKPQYECISEVSIGLEPMDFIKEIKKQVEDLQSKCFAPNITTDITTNIVEQMKLKRCFLFDLEAKLSNYIKKHNQVSQTKSSYESQYEWISKVSTELEPMQFIREIEKQLKNFQARYFEAGASKRIALTDNFLFDLKAKLCDYVEHNEYNQNTHKLADLDIESDDEDDQNKSPNSSTKSKYEWISEVSIDLKPMQFIREIEKQLANLYLEFTQTDNSGCKELKDNFLSDLSAKLSDYIKRNDIKVESV
jgi:hypothetical protein